MLRRRVREGSRAGTIAAAATAGALIALGYAHGAALRPLNSVAHLLVGSRAYYMESVSLLVTPLAIAVHFGSVILWGIVLALLTPGLTGGRLYPASLSFAALTWLLDSRIVPERLRPGFESGLSSSEIALLYLLLGLSLAWGLDRERRFATDERG